MNSKDKEIIHKALMLLYEDLANDPFTLKRYNNKDVSINDIWSFGLCARLKNLFFNNKITDIEERVTSKYIYYYVDRYKSMFLFPKYQLKPRFEWLEKHIELTKPNSNELKR